MKLELTRPLAFIDIESTGLDVAHDRIVELGIYRLHPDDKPDAWCWLFNPGFPIPAEVTAVHGITSADVANKPPFKECAHLVHEMLTGCDLAGYNLLNFDVPLLWEEFHRAGIEWDLSGVQIVDAGNIFKKREPRTLSAAVQLYAGREHEGAHGAAADAKATAEVLAGQVARYSDIGSTVEELAAYSRMDEGFERIDLAGKLLRRLDDGRAVYGFGKNRGTAVVDDPGFAEWMLRKDFSVNTKRAVRKVLGEEVYRRPAATPVAQTSMARELTAVGVGGGNGDPFADE